MNSKKGLVQIVMMISLLILAVALPVISQVVKRSQDTRRKAAETLCGNEGQDCCYGLSGSRSCSEGLLCTDVEVDDGFEGGVPVVPPGGGWGGGLLPDDPWPPVVPPGWIGGGLVPGDPWPPVVPPEWGIAPTPPWGGAPVDQRAPTPTPYVVYDPGNPNKPTPKPTSEMGTPGKSEPTKPPVDMIPVVPPGDGRGVVAPTYGLAPIKPPSGGEYYKGVLGVTVKSICIKSGGTVPSTSPIPSVPPSPPIPSIGPVCHPLIGCIPECSCGPRTIPGANNDACIRCSVVTPPISAPPVPICTPIPCAGVLVCKKEGGCPGGCGIECVIPEITDTITETPEPTKKPTEIPISCAVCKQIGDYNCDEVVNGIDYTWWKQEFVDKLQHEGKWQASHDCSDKVTPEDYSRWRYNYLN